MQNAAVHRVYLILQYGAYFLLATPLIFGTKLLFPFVTYRTYFFVFVAIILIAAAAHFGVIQWELFRSSRILQAAGVFLTVKLFTDIIGLDASTSLWGAYERMMGFAVWLLLLFFLLLARSLWQSPKAYTGAFTALGAVGALASLYGLLQHFNIAFRVNDVDDRLFSTMGNPAFLAGFLLLSIAGTVIAWTYRRGARRAWLASALLLQLWALYLTATRGAILGLAGALVFLCFLALWRPAIIHPLHPKKARYTAAVFLATLCLLPVFFVLARDATLVRSSTTMRRLADISLRDFSARSRLLVWQSGLRAAMPRLATGYGENHVAVALDRFFDPRISEQWFDSTHNAWLDTLLSHGVFGLLAVLALFAMAFQALLKTRDHALPASFCAAGLVGYIIQSFFIFDTLPVLAPLMIFFAYSAAMPTALVIPAARPALASGRVPLWAALALAVLLGVVYFRSWRALSLASAARHAQAPLENRLEAFAAARQIAPAGHGDLARVSRDLAAEVLSQNFPPGEKTLALAEMDEAYQTARRREAPYSRFFVDPAKTYLDAPKEIGDYTEATLGLLREAEELSPGRVDIQYAFVQAYIQDRDYDAAIAVLDQASSRFPLQRADIEFKRAQVYRVAKKYPESLASLRAAIAAGYAPDTAALMWFGRGYVDGGFLEGAQAIEKMIDERGQ